MSIVNVSSIVLDNGIRMPMIGLGTYRISPAQTKRAVLDALEVGYRLVDTAQCYGNEEAVGSAVASSSVARDEVFITTKTWTNGYADTVCSIERSLSALRTDYIDLLLIHEPTGDIPGIYRALEEAYDEGKVRAIGLSNFMETSLRAVLAGARIKPMVNQVETHPLRRQERLHTYCEAHGIVMQSWSPLVAGSKSVLKDEHLRAIAQAHGKSTAQVVLKWLIQRGIPFVSKSLDREHMKENLELFDFLLTSEESEVIDAMDTDNSQFSWW